ncbi:hypothetical protein Tco_0783620 [Tanacetum coccineum]
MQTDSVSDIDDMPDGCNISVRIISSWKQNTEIIPGYTAINHLYSSSSSVRRFSVSGDMLFIPSFSIKKLNLSLGKGLVFSTWMAFGGNTRDLGSFREEMDEITDLHQILEEILLTERGDGVASIKRRRRDLFSDGVWNLETTSGRGRLKRI